MSKSELGVMPVIKVKTDQTLCHEIPENICRCFQYCDVCPFDNGKSTGGVILIIEKESDHEKN